MEKDVFRCASRKGNMFFRGRRSAQQAKEYAIAMGEGRTFTLLEPAKLPIGITQEVRVWEPRTRSLTSRSMPVADDPFLDEAVQKDFPGAVSPFSIFNNLSSSAKSVKMVARFFFNILMAAFK